jgi:hypothetical protein
MESQDLLGPADWNSLRAHHERGALLWVAPTLELRLVVDRIAADDVAQVGAWLKSGALLKPTAAQTTLWDQTPDRSFNVAIVQPYVLMQELPH